MYILTEDSVIFHPGYYLFEIMHDRKISVEQLTEDTGYDSDYISGVLIGRNDITGNFADRLYDFFGISPGYWLNLQKAYDTGCRNIRENDLKYRIVR